MAESANRDVEEFLQNVAKAENIVAPAITKTFTGSKGDGYTSTITGYAIEGKNKKIDVVVKLVRPVADYLNEQLHAAYVREAKFYSEVVPSFKKFQQDYNIAMPFDSTPTFYGASEEKCKEMLVLENLRANNYVLWDRKHSMNREHLEFVMRNYGKFHGTSFALKRLRPDEYKRLAKDYQTNLMKEFMDQPSLGEHQRQITIKLIDIFDDGSKYKERVKHFAHNFSGFIADELYNLEGESCLVQGDCWCNNMMFKYTDKNDQRQPIAMKMLDFQITSVGSPASDLSYFFYTIAPDEYLEKVEDFLQIYHNSMAAHVKLFGIDLNEDYPFAALMTQWRRYSKFGLIMAILVCQIMLTDSTDAPEFLENPDDINIKLSSSALSNYHNKMRSLFKHFIDRNYI